LPPLIELYISGIEGKEIQFEGARAKSWVLWASNGLGVYMEVKDSILSDINDAFYMQDSIEVFIDENNNKTISYEKDDAQYRVNFKNLQSSDSAGSFEGFESAAKIVSGGYIVEVFIPFRTITASVGNIVGFDLQVYDDQGSGKRDSISKWNDPTNNSWQSTFRFGLIM